MHRHPHYATTLQGMGADVGRLPCGTLALRRRFGPLRLLWLPQPMVLPDLASLPAAAVISAASQVQDGALRGSGAIRLLTPQARAVLRLTQAGDLQRAGQHQKWRNRLRHAESQGLRVCHAPLPRDPTHWLLQAEAAQQCARGYRALPPEFALHWPQTRLFLARRGTSVLAAQLFLLHAPGASYHIGWSGPEGRAASAHNLLLWEAGRWLAAQGITRLDLGPVNRDSPGLARFKLGSGARIEAAGHTWLASRFLAPLGRLIG
ncbi:GNAT family N-acetyltransferase [Oceanicola sp. S124]|uniref:GNAT family N-acetyltransferase n=1 Tax=Oceanicola sp. S124 TaxID=1042378 RepID=UPI0006834DF3|nr:GNAT family N-acetyltransferase [Oceanicola sp. S124]